MDAPVGDEGSVDDGVEAPPTDVHDSLEMKAYVGDEGSVYDGVEAPPADREEAEVSGDFRVERPVLRVEITHVIVEKRPFRVYVYVDNQSGRFVNADVRLVDKEGRVLFKHRSRRYEYLTPQSVNTRKAVAYRYAGGAANNLIVLTSPRVADNWDFKAYGYPRYRVPVRFHRFGGYDADRMSIELVNGDRVLSVFPDTQVAAAPVLTRRLATSWGAIKRSVHRGR